MPNLPHNPPPAPRLTVSRYDERFLEKSWQWLNDPEIKRLTMTPDFTREDQQRWFARLPSMTDYRVWGLVCGDLPIGAFGLKQITQSEATYWGYIGERSFWGAGLGGEMLRIGIEQAKALGLREINLKVHRDNSRAIRLYTKTGFQTVGEHEGVVEMRMSVCSP